MEGGRLELDPRFRSALTDATQGGRRVRGAETYRHRHGRMVDTPCIRASVRMTRARTSNDTPACSRGGDQLIVSSSARAARTPVGRMHASGVSIRRQDPAHHHPRPEAEARAPGDRAISRRDSRSGEKARTAPRDNCRRRSRSSRVWPARSFSSCARVIIGPIGVRAQTRDLVLTFGRFTSSASQGGTRCSGSCTCSRRGSSRRLEGIGRPSPARLAAQVLVEVRRVIHREAGRRDNGRSRVY